MRVDTSGRVGIGTSSPVNRLTVGGDGASLVNSYATYLANSYFDGAWKYIGNGVAWGIGNNFSGVTNGVTIAVASVNSGGANAALTWNPAFNIDTSGNVGIGTSSPLSSAGYTALTVQNNTNGGIVEVKNSAVQLRMQLDSTSTGNFGTYTNHPLLLLSNATERARIDTSGNVLVTGGGGLGYGTGSGGTVTQATNKATAVTLDKPTGRITMNGAALAANTTVQFTFNNSLIGSNDMVVINITGNAATAASYNIGTRSLSAGSVVIGIRNVTGGSLSESLELTFALIKGATS